MEMEEEFLSTCKNCGSDLFYNPKEGCLTCKYCQSNFYLPTQKRDAILVRQYSVGFHPNMLNSNLNSYKCNSCGRTYFMTTEGRSSRCPNCGNSSCSLVSERGYCADGIVPFSITKEEATQKLSEYLKSHKSVPKGLKELVAGQKLMAVYIPVWNFAFNMFANYSATEHYVQKGYGGSYYNAQKPIFGDKSKHIESMDECATDGEDETFLELFDEEDYAKIVPYIPEYACGVRIDPVTKDIHEFYNKILQKAQSDFEAQITRSIKNQYSNAMNIDIRSRARDVFFNFTYVPVYVNTYNYKGKLYKLYVSGTTGKVAGKTPVSISSFFKKLFKIVGIGAIIAAAYLLFK